LRNFGKPRPQPEKILEIMKGIVAEIIDEKNKRLARFETIKKFSVLPCDFTEEAGEVTPTLKVKRKFVTEKYKEVLDKMY